MLTPQTDYWRMESPPPLVDGGLDVPYYIASWEYMYPGYTLAEFHPGRRPLTLINGEVHAIAGMTIGDQGVQLLAGGVDDESGLCDVLDGFGPEDLPLDGWRVVEMWSEWETGIIHPLDVLQFENDFHVTLTASRANMWRSRIAFHQGNNDPTSRYDFTLRA